MYSSSTSRCVSKNLSEETQLDIVAYILQTNGALAGNERLTTATDVEIGKLIGSVSK